MPINFNRYYYNKTQLEQLQLLPPDLELNTKNLQDLHQQICEAARIHLKASHNLRNKNYCQATGQSELQHRKVAYLYNTMSDDKDKIKLSTENKVTCWPCHYFNGKQTLEIVRIMRNENALYAICNQCSTQEITAKIQSHTTEDGFYSCQKTTSDDIVIHHDTNTQIYSIFYKGEPLSLDDFNSLDPDTQNKIRGFLLKNNQSLRSLV